MPSERRLDGRNEVIVMTTSISPQSAFACRLGAAGEWDTLLPGDRQLAPAPEDGEQDAIPL